MEDDIFLKMKDDLIFLKMEDNLKKKRNINIITISGNSKGKKPKKITLRGPPNLFHPKTSFFVT